MNLPHHIIEKITDKEWYHQGFDGCPLFILAIAEAEVQQEKRKPAGSEADVRVCFFDGQTANWYLRMDDVERGAQALLDVAQQNPNLSTQLLAEWKTDEEAFFQYFLRDFPLIDLSSLSDEELIAEWKRFTSLFMKRTTSSAIIDHFALGTDTILHDLLRTEVNQHKSKPVGDNEFTELFSVATAPTKQSFINQAEIELLQIAVGDSTVMVAEYQQQYFWTRNNYIMAQELSIEHFQQEIDDWIASGKDLRVVIQNLQGTPELNRQRKDQLFEQYDFSEYLKTLITISDDFTWWQDERKRATYFNIHIGVKFLEEIERRITVPVDLLKYAYAHEIPSIIMQQEPSRVVLEERHKSSVCIYTREEVLMVTGEDVEQIRRTMLPEQDFSDVTEVRGLSASRGQATGAVRILYSATEVGKVEEGDILVAVMTRPDYLPAMKRAAAIVTDEGGVTSHAAIVSRELGIPCIIGTKDATKIFKDGDSIEVNAHTGIAKKLTNE